MVESPRHRSSRRKSVDTRLKKTGKKDRNLSALLPELGLENRRYPDDEIQKVKAEDRNMLNFVQASKKQMRDVIGLQQPQAKRFFDDSLINTDVKISTIETTNKATFSSRMRPSIQSVKQSNLKMEALSSLDHLNDEISDMTYNRRQSRAAFQQHRNTVSSNVAHLISPRSGLMQVPSKISLATEGQQPFRSPSSVLVDRGPGSPAAQSSTVTNLKRELKHLSRYLDTREMQIRTALDGTQKLDERLKHNKNMEELYHQVMIQVRSKLPQSSMFLGEVVIRVMDGLQECFQLQQKSLQKKVDIRNKKIELLNNEMAEQKEIFYEFKRNKTIDAYFRKYGDDVIIKTGRKEKDYLKDLVKTVDEFLENDGSILQKTDVFGERQISKDTEPSGVNSLLIQLSQQTKNLEIPSQPKNPIAGIDQQRDTVMNDFKKTLKYEANEVRGLIENHVKNTMGLTKPTADGETQTLTFWRLKETITDEFRRKIEDETAERANANANIKHARLNKEIEALTGKNIALKEKVSDLQYKLGHLGKEAFLEDIKLQINQFFASRLGKKNQHILKEFNENILGITEAKVEQLSQASPLGKKGTLHSPKINIAKLTNSREGSSFIKLQKSHESIQSTGAKVKPGRKYPRKNDEEDEDEFQSDALSETEYSASVSPTSKLSRHQDFEAVKSHKSRAPSALKIEKTQKPGQIVEITTTDENIHNVLEELATPERKDDSPSAVPKEVVAVVDSSPKADNDIVDDSLSPEPKGKKAVDDSPTPEPKGKKEAVAAANVEENKALSTPTMTKQQSASSAGGKKSGGQSKSPSRKNNQSSKAVSGGKKGGASPTKGKKDAIQTTIKEEPEDDQVNNQDIQQYQTKVEGLVDSSPSKTRDNSPTKKMNATGGAQSKMNATGGAQSKMNATGRAQSTREDQSPSKKGGDDRKKLMEELKEVKVITNMLKENMGLTKMNKSDEQVESVILTLERVQVTAEITTKIVKLNADVSIVNLSKSFLDRANKLCEKMIEIKTLRGKIKNGLEVHELVESINKLLRRKSKTLPERDDIMAQLSKLELAESKLEGQKLTKKDYEKMNTIEKQLMTLDKEMSTQILDIKFVKAQKGAAKSKKSTKQEVETLNLKAENTENQVADAIVSMQKVKSQISEDNSLSLFQATQQAQKKGRTLQKQQLISSKARRLLQYMTEIIKWLQSSESGTFEIDDAEESELADSKRSSTHRLQGLSTQSLNKTKKSTFTVRSDAHSPDQAKEQSPYLPNKKTIITVKGKISPEKIIQQMNNNDQLLTVSDHQLGRIGEVMEIDTQEGRLSPLAYDSDTSKQRNQSHLLNKNHNERPSRVEVFSTRKTPSKFNRDGGGEEQPKDNESPSEGGGDNEQQNEAANQTTRQQQQKKDERLDLIPQAGSESPGLDKNYGNRKQFAELFNMEKTAQRSGDANTFQIAQATSEFNENKTAQKTMQLQTQQSKQKQPQNNSNRGITQPGAKDINLRQSADQTDYLKTASHFGAETVRADLKSINVGLVHNNQQASETQDFLNVLKTNVAVDKKKSVFSKAKHEVYLHDKKTNMGMQTTLRTTAQLNKDLVEQTAQLEQKINDTSNLYLDDQLDSGYLPNQQQSNKKSPVAKLSPSNKQLNSPKMQIKMQMLQDLRNLQPSELKITKIPYHSHIKVLQESDNDYLAMPEANIRQKQALGSVLMLTQETQTENRSLIKYLLTLINETIMAQLEEKSIRMTNDDFKESVSQFTQAIPNVYDRIKQKSDTFFIDDQLGPNFTTAQHLADTNFEMNPRNFSKLSDQNQHNNKDLLGMIDQIYDSARHNVVESPQQVPLQPVYGSGAGGGVTVARQQQNPQLSPIASIKALHESPSQKRLIQQNASVGTNFNAQNSPSAANLANVVAGKSKSPPRSQMVQFLSIGDFSRYGNHTLELSQEIKTRVNLRQVGAAGGGFMGHKVKNLPTNNHLE